MPLQPRLPQHRPIISRGPAPQGANQPLAAAIASSHHDFIQQQAAILANIRRQRDSSLVSPRPGIDVTDGSAAGTVAAASALPLEMPLGGRNSSTGSLACAEKEDQYVDACVVCMDGDKNWLCLPCGHLAMCGACSARVKCQTGRCPICQQSIQQVVQVFRA